LPALLKDSTPSTLAPLDLTSTLTLDLARPQFLLDVLIPSAKASLMEPMCSTTCVPLHTDVLEDNTLDLTVKLEPTSTNRHSSARAPYQLDAKILDVWDRLMDSM
jgi:hypothetical protein